ncbi:MAG: hypothetical protein ACE5K9_11100 [Candidatus Methylomirabilales bacterium]
MPMPMSNDRGFSAIDVLIAATITVVALLAIANMAPTSYQNVDRSGKDTVAVTLAQQRLEQLKNLPFTDPGLADPSPGALPGPAHDLLPPENVNVDGAVYTRTTNIEDDPASLGGLAGIKQVTVTVRTPTGRSVQLVSHIAQ